MCAETGCVPYVVVVGVLCVALVLSGLTVNVDCRRCSVGYCAYWNSYVAKACRAALPVTVKDTVVVVADWSVVIVTLDIWSWLCFR